jgi:L-cysteine/cystine lyase
MARVMDPSRFRAEFPVLERVAYLNAGTDGPIARAGAEAARARLTKELEGGRSGKEHFEGLTEMNQRRRELLAGLLGCDASEVALTHSTTDGVNIVLGGLDLTPGDEVLTSDEEHPGVLAPLAARERRGVTVRRAPFAELASAVTAKTRLVATSHVSWVGGKVMDAAALRETGVPVLVTHGVADDAWSPAEQHEMAERLGARYASIAGAVHSPACEAPEPFVEVLLDFWRFGR